MVTSRFDQSVSSAKRSVMVKFKLFRIQDNLNFTITERFAPDTDWSKREVTMNLHFRASLACMGGEPTPDDLLLASDIIRRGAELVKELEAMNLSYTERH